MTFFSSGKYVWWVCNRKTAGQKGLDGARESTEDSQQEGQSVHSPNLENSEKWAEKFTF